MFSRKKEGFLSILDLGATKVCAGVARVDDTGQLELLGLGIYPTRGMRNGSIVDLDETCGAVRRAVDDAQKGAQTAMGPVTLSVNSRGMKSFNSNGSLQLGPNPVQITPGFFQKCMDNASNFSVSAFLEPMHIVLRHCTVDEFMEVDNPIGMEGKKLEVELHVIALPKTQITHFTKAANQAGLTVQSMLLQPLASAEASLSREDKEYGALFLDIGSCTTTGVVYQRGKIQHSFSLPVGGDHFTRDIITGLRTTMKEAEKLKCLYGTLSSDTGQGASVIEIQGAGSGKPRQISVQILTEIIQPRAEEILDLVRSEITTAGFENTQFACAILSGGGALLKDLIGLAEKQLDIPCRLTGIQLPEKWPAELASPAYASTVGLFHRSLHVQSRGKGATLEQMVERRTPLQKSSNRLKHWFDEILSL